MSPQEYETFVASVYERDGYHVSVTPYAGDGGIDVIAVKDGKRIAIQCKKYGHTTRSVNTAMIHTLFGAAKAQDCDEAHMVTDGNLLPDAEKAAEKLGVCVRYIYPDSSTTGLANIQKENNMVSNNTSINMDINMIEKLKSVPSFNEIWKRVKALVGKRVYLLKQNEEFNIITNVDNAGLKRISKNGKPSKKPIPIEAFRFAYNKLIQNTEVTRDEINQEYPDRCSSIVVAVLATVMPVDVIMVRPLRLKLNI